MAKRFKLIFFMSLMLILILGTTSQANITQDYIKYTFEHFKNGNCLSSYQGNVNRILNNLNDIDYNFYTSYINNVLVENNINKLTDNNMTSVLDFNYGNIQNVVIYFIFSNVSAPNGIDNLGFLEFSRVENFNNYLKFFCHESDSYIYVLKLSVSDTSKHNFGNLNKVNNSSKFTVYFMRNSNLNSDNSILTISNVACTQAQSVYYHVPFSTIGITLNSQGFIRGLSLENDPGYFEIQTPEPPQPSGDSGGTTGIITNSSGDTTGKVDLSGIEQGIGNINQNIDKTNEKLDGISGEINELNNSVNNINNFLSGDITKNLDDIKGSLTIDTSEIDDPSEDFFTWVFNQIQNVFISTEEQSFNFKLFTENEYTVSSSQIYVPDSVIKTLISYASAFGIYYWIIKDVRKTINKIKEGNIENLGNEDVTANLL